MVVQVIVKVTEIARVVTSTVVLEIGLITVIVEDIRCISFRPVVK